MANTGVRTVGRARTGWASGDAGRWYAVLAVLALGAAGVIFVVYPWSFVGADFDVYRGGAGAVLDGAPLYDFRSNQQLTFTYPPFAALVFLPLALLPAALAAACWAAISVVALELVIWLVVGSFGVTGRVARLRWTAMGSAAMLPLGPVAFHLWVGQMNLILLFLVIVDIIGKTGRFRGVAIGVAAAIKLIPLIFIPYLLFTRRWRAARTAALAFAGATGVGFLVLPRDSARYWFDTFWDLRSIIPADVPTLNASIRGLLDRLSVAQPGLVWLVLAGAVGALGFAVSVWASRRGYELAGVLACGITGLLISPVSWIFHWVWCVPLLLLWARRAQAGNLLGEKAGVILTWLACVGSFYWIVLQFLLVPPPAAMTLLFANLFVVIGVAALGAIAVFIHRCR